MKKPDFSFKTRGSVVWTALLSYYLNKAGTKNLLVDFVPEEGIICFHARFENSLKASIKNYKNKVLVCTQADWARVKFADYHLVQNPLQEKGRAKYIPHLPQPGIISRDLKRGNVIENICYKGAPSNLVDSFTSDEWKLFLKENSLNWFNDSEKNDFTNYSKMDIVVAIRRHRKNLWITKPASKLVNAWIGRVPAILGREIAYKSLRRNELDYIEADSMQEVKSAILNLKNNPSLYYEMTKNCTKRRREFTTENIVQAYIDFFTSIDVNEKFKTLKKVKGYIEYRVFRAIWFLQNLS